MGRNDQALHAQSQTPRLTLCWLFMSCLCAQDELQQHGTEELVLSVAGNKADLRSAAESAPVLRAAETYSKSIGAAHFETSAKTGRGVSECFKTVAQLALKMHLDRLSRRTTHTAGGAAGAQKGGGAAGGAGAAAAGSAADPARGNSTTVDISKAPAQQSSGCCY
jgi:hypothetical protein